jgi:hypothetical protein
MQNAWLPDFADSICGIAGVDVGDLGILSLRLL